jgi:hypothetical protein
VGIVGLGPMAGILAIALHSLGTYGKLFAESIESLDGEAIEAVRATGATPLQVFGRAVLPQVAPQFVSHHLYLWEFNFRDSTVLGLIGAGGLGLLISEAVSLFQWPRLATLLLSVGASVDPLPVVSTGHPGAMNTVSLTTSMSHGLQAVKVVRKMEAKMVCRMAEPSTPDRPTTGKPNVVTS